MMDKEDVQQLVEEIVSMRLQADEYRDREFYDDARNLDIEVDGVESELEDAGYTLETDKNDSNSVHVLASDGTRYATFHTGEWQWIED